MGELRPVHGDVHPGAQDDPAVAAGERGEQGRQRQAVPVDADQHLQVEPVGAGGVVVLAGARGEVHHRGALRGAVVGAAADLGDLDLAGGRERGQHGGGDVDRLVAGEHLLRHEAALPVARAAQPVHGVVVEDEGVEQLPLLARLPEAAQAPGLPQAVDPLALAHGVAPGPGQLDPVDRHPGDGERPAGASPARAARPSRRRRSPARAAAAGGGSRRAGRRGRRPGRRASRRWPPAGAPRARRRGRAAPAPAPSRSAGRRATRRPPRGRPTRPRRAGRGRPRRTTRRRGVRRGRGGRRRWRRC